MGNGLAASLWQMRWRLPSTWPKEGGEVGRGVMKYSTQRRLQRSKREVHEYWADCYTSSDLIWLVANVYFGINTLINWLLSFSAHSFLVLRGYL